MIKFENSSANLNEETLKCLEQFWEYTLPNDYRKFLLSKNGGYPDKRYFLFKEQANGSVIQAFLGITPKDNLNLLKEQKIYINRIPNTMFPIAYDTLGNLILISVKGSDRGKIFFWDHEQEVMEGEIPDYSNLTLIADNFIDFIENLKDDII